jgi:hypothetical protein
VVDRAPIPSRKDMSGRCVKILALVTLIPVALRASSLLIGGHGGVPATSWHVSRRRPAATTGLSVSAGLSVRKAYQHSARRRAPSTIGGSGESTGSRTTRGWRRRGQIRCTTYDDDGGTRSAENEGDETHLRSASGNGPYILRFLWLHVVHIPTEHLYCTFVPYV